MKKDIKIPKVANVYLVIAPEYNDLFKTNDWNVYIVNDKNVDIDLVLILSKGFDKNRETAQMKHKIDLLPTKSAVKFELMVEEVLVLDNEFKVTFFCENKLFEKTYLIPANTAKESTLRMVKTIGKRGIVIN